MFNFFNKKIESKFIDNLLVKFYIFILFFMPIIVLFCLLLNCPYKEVLICNSSKCSLEQHFLFSNSNIADINRPINVTVRSGGANILRSYWLMMTEYNRLFQSSYYIPYFAYSDKDLIESSDEKLKITKYNPDIFIVLIFNIMLVILLIYGRINYLKKYKKISDQISENKSTK